MISFECGGLWLWNLELLGVDIPWVDPPINIMEYQQCSSSGHYPNGIIKHRATITKLMAIQNVDWYNKGRWMHDLLKVFWNDWISIQWLAHIMIAINRNIPKYIQIAVSIVFRFWVDNPQYTWLYLHCNPQPGKTNFTV